jgi:purine-binding chemotaxis protein CheW
MSTDKATVDQSQHLTFFIGGEEYAVGILRVKEIIQYDTVTRVPKAPPWIRGVINLRGSVVPVADLGVKFGLPESPITKTTCIVIAETNFEGERIVMGILVDAVSQVVELPREEVQAPPAFGTRVRIDYLLGMGRAGKKFALILDVDKILSADEVLAAISATRDADVGAQVTAPEPAATAES